MSGHRHLTSGSSWNAALSLSPVPPAGIHLVAYKTRTVVHITRASTLPPQHSAGRSVRVLIPALIMEVITQINEGVQ